ncbi:MAG: hypothetical protein L3J08_00195 [Flavobacteriaceae bacterium]|nr:hypothetical protein [Flavobacteriaceae bacterium]
MTLANYISDLLYRYECIIVPNFGGFITNNKSAKIDSINQTLLPPYKQITFNHHLKNNDGLLASYIASVDKIPYKSAINFIQFEIENWKNKLEHEDLFLEEIGSFSLEDEKLHFEPQKKINYLTSSFGLNSIAAPEVKRIVNKKQAEKLEEKAPIILSAERKKAPNYLKYAAIFVIGLSAVGYSAKLYRDYQNNQLITTAKEQQEIINQKIENATFVITKPLPTLNLDITAQKQNYHVIAGAFRFPKNAIKKVNQLKVSGYNAQILGVNKWNLSVVSFQSYSTEQEARNILVNIQDGIEKDAWLLIQEF